MKGNYCSYLFVMSSVSTILSPKFSTVRYENEYLPSFSVVKSLNLKINVFKFLIDLYFHRLFV